MLELEGIEGLNGVSEYNNAGALLGLDGLDGDDLMGVLGRMNPLMRARTINKLTGGIVPSRGSRGEMEKHFSELPQHIKNGLVSTDLRLADTLIYSIKPVSSKTIKMFETQDDKEIGLRNVSNAKLPKNQALLVSGIILLAGISADMTKDKVMATRFGAVEEFAPIVNGEFSLKSNKKQIVPETGNNVFKTSNMHNVPLGYYKLANPRLIHDDILMEMTIELGTMDGLDAKTHLFVGLHGTITTP